MFRPAARNICLAILPAIVMTALPVLAKATEMKCLDDAAATRGYSLGYPVDAEPVAGGKTVLYLRSGPRDTLQRLYAFDIASGREREVIAPDSLLGGNTEKLSAEEKARRERARISVSGFTKFALAHDGSRVLLTLGGKLYVVSLTGNRVDTPLPGLDWLAPKLSPDGTKVAALRNGDIHVLDIATGRDAQITHGATATITNGEAEFVAQEEMERRDGFWWSPDSRFIAYEQADLSPVEPHYIADPLVPQEKPIEFRYPRAGTANALVKLGVVAVTGGTTRWVPWDNKAWPYLVRVEWQRGGPLALLVENRPQTEEHYLAADPATGATRLLWTERDAAWLSTPASEPKEIPYWLPDGSGFLWMTERNGQSQLERHDAAGRLLNAVTPPDFRYEALLDVDEKNGTAIVQGGADRLSKQIYSVSLKGGAPMPVAAARGWNSGAFGEQHAVFAHAFDLLDGSRGADVLARDGSKIATLPSAAEAPPFLPEPSYFEVGAEKFDALVLRPRDFDPGRKYPVLLAVYGGPAAKTVWAAPRQYLANQCLADMGYIIASSDNRGTPGRDAAWIRAVKGNAIDIPLADQITALKGLGQLVPQMDLGRVGVFGWSFGGYFAAMATIRRPDIFAAGVAGAPVVDWQDYDTYYTERYMGLPQENAAGYRASNVLTYAPGLQRPLLIVHGVTDDNVYFQNTMKLTLALLATGRPYDLILLPGTHMLSDNLLRARETEAQMRFFAAHLGSETVRPDKTQ
jgi:dipeptidyl-peptidase-4